MTCKACSEFNTLQGRFIQSGLLPTDRIACLVISVMHNGEAECIKGKVGRACIALPPHCGSRSQLGGHVLCSPQRRKRSAPPDLKSVRRACIASCKSHLPPPVVEPEGQTRPLWVDPRPRGSLDHLLASGVQMSNFVSLLLWE